MDFQPGLGGTISLTTGYLAIIKDLTIAGPGAKVITVSGHHASQVFVIPCCSTVAMSGLTIADGQPPSFYPIGGGIYNLGTLTITGCTFIGNSASNSGGGIAEWGGRLTVTGCTFIGNSASGYSGGAIFNNVGEVTVTGCTFIGNSAVYGGGISTSGVLTITSSTLSGNSASVYGGGISNGGAVHFRNTIIASNTAPSGPDFYGNLGSQGYNLLGNPQDASGWVDTDILHVNPRLGPLQDNGGPTPTMALLPGSPAIDAGDPAQLGVPDQRGVVRSGGVNIGAYEASATAFVLGASARATRFGSSFLAPPSLGLSCADTGSSRMTAAVRTISNLSALQDGLGQAGIGM